MTGELWKWVWWGVATLGVGGTIALIASFPAVSGAVVRFFTIVLSYRIGCAVVAAALAWIVADYVRHSIEDKKHAAQVAEFIEKQKQRDARIAQETRDIVAAEQLAADAENSVTDKDVKDFTDALPQSGNVFRVGADAARLRRLAGQSERGSDGAKGVPEADTKPASLRDRIRKRLPGGGSGIAGSDRQGQ
jgi:hypothetical protein